MITRSKDASRKFISQLHQLVSDVEAKNWPNLPMALSGWHHYITSVLQLPKDSVDGVLTQIETELTNADSSPVLATNAVFGLSVLSSILPSSTYLKKLLM